MPFESGQKSLKTEPDLIHTDGSFWVASYESEATAMACLFDRSAPCFFFREVVQGTERRWWWHRLVWRYTGKTWQGHKLEDGCFTMLKKEPSK